MIHIDLQTVHYPHLCWFTGGTQRKVGKLHEQPPLAPLAVPQTAEPNINENTPKNGVPQNSRVL